MQLDLNAFSLTLFFYGLIATLISIVIMYRLSDAVKWFAFTILAVSIWALAYGFELSSQTEAAMLFWIKIQYIGIALAPATWLWFCLKYCGFEKWIDLKTFVIIFTLPAITYLLVVTNEYHHLHYRAVSMVVDGPFPMLKIEVGPWYFVHVIYFYTCLVLGNIFLFFRFKEADPTFKKQIFLLFIAGFFPWIINILYHIGLRPFEHIDLTPYSFLFFYIIIGIGLLRFELFNLKPIARDKIISAMTKGVLIFDPKERIIDYNPAMEKILGNPPSKWIGKELPKVFGNHPVIASSMKGKGIEKIEINLFVNLEKKDFEIELIPLLDKKKNLSGMLLLFEDITEKKNIEKQLITQSIELRNLNEQKDKLFSIISHDLRGPITGVKEVIKMTQNNMVSQDEFFKILPEISKSMDSVTSLLENLLAWTSSQFKGERIEKSDFNLNPLLDNIVELFESYTQQREIKLNLMKTENCHVFADRNMIDLIIRNLVNNAVKFSGKNDQVTILAQKEGNRTHIKIKDTGMESPRKT